MIISSFTWPGFNSATTQRSVFNRRPSDTLFGHDTREKVPVQLKRLFQAIPKTELDTHLSRSVRRSDIKAFMRENGLTPAEVDSHMRLIKPHYINLTDYLDTYYKVPAHVRTPDQFRRATLGLIKAVAKENVRLLEIRSSILGKGGDPHTIIDAIETGMRQGETWVKKHYGYDIKTGLIILAQRYKSAEESLAHARLAIASAQRPQSKIIGFDLAGDEIFHAIEKHEAAIKLIKQEGAKHGIKLTLHAGEVPVSEGASGLDSLKKALAYGVDRIGHGLQAQQDPATKKHLMDTQLPLELCPWSNVQTQAVSSYPTHPIKSFLDDGLNVNLNTDSRLICAITLTKQLAQLWQHGILRSWSQLKTITLNGIKASFLKDTDKDQVKEQTMRHFSQLEQRFKNTIKRYLSVDGTNQPFVLKKHRVFQPKVAS